VGALVRKLPAMVLVQVAFGLGLAIAMAGMPAIVGDRYHYADRGRALGIVRLAMPLTLIAVVPGMVVLGVRFGVRAPFATMGTAAFLLFLLVAWRLPRMTGRPPAPGLGTAGGRGWVRPQVILLLILALGLSMVPTAVFGFLSAWVTETFGDPARNVGLVLTGDGLGALAGAGLGALLVDRLTKRRAGMLSLGLGGAFGLALALGQRSLGLGVGAIVGLSASLELSLIALSALLTESAPEARGAVTGLWAAALAMGSAVSPLVARVLWLRGGMAAIAGAGGALLLVLAAAFAVGVVEPKGTASNHE
jgi:predicted MFS family arabinose efflux permease